VIRNKRQGNTKTTIQTSKAKRSTKDPRSPLLAPPRPEKSWEKATRHHGKFWNRLILSRHGHPCQMETAGQKQTKSRRKNQHLLKMPSNQCMTQMLAAGRPRTVTKSSKNCRLWQGQRKQLRWKCWRMKMRCRPGRLRCITFRRSRCLPKRQHRQLSRQISDQAIPCRPRRILSKFNRHLKIPTKKISCRKETRSSSNCHHWQGLPRLPPKRCLRMRMRCPQQC